MCKFSLYCVSVLIGSICIDANGMNKNGVLKAINDHQISQLQQLDPNAIIDRAAVEAAINTKDVALIQIILDHPSVLINKEIVKCAIDTGDRNVVDILVCHQKAIINEEIVQAAVDTCNYDALIDAVYRNSLPSNDVVKQIMATRNKSERNRLSEEVASDNREKVMSIITEIIKETPDRSEAKKDICNALAKMVVSNPSKTFITPEFIEYARNSGQTKIAEYLEDKYRIMNMPSLWDSDSSDDNDL